MKKPRIPECAREAPKNRLVTLMCVRCGSKRRYAEAEIGGWNTPEHKLRHDVHARCLTCGALDGHCSSWTAVFPLALPNP